MSTERKKMVAALVFCILAFLAICLRIRLDVEHEPLPEELCVNAGIVATTFVGFFFGFMYFLPPVSSKDRRFASILNTINVVVFLVVWFSLCHYPLNGKGTSGVFAFWILVWWLGTELIIFHEPLERQFRRIQHPQER